MTGPKRIALLTLLALELGRPVSRDRIIEALWPNRLKGREESTLRVHVSHLRDLLEPPRDRDPQVIVTQGSGYSTGTLAGRPLQDVEYEEFAQPEIRRLEQARVEALENRAAAWIELARTVPPSTTWRARSDSIRSRSDRCCSSCGRCTASAANPTPYGQHVATSAPGERSPRLTPVDPARGTDPPT